MTRKKYDVDTFNDESTSDSGSSSDESDRELDPDKVLSVVKGHWSEWKTSHIAQFVTESDLYEFFMTQPDPIRGRSYVYEHLFKEGEEELHEELYGMLVKISEDLKLNSNVKVPQVLYDILRTRDKFCVIAPRGPLHWSWKWCQVLREIGI